MGLSDIADVQISASTKTPTRLGFGTPLLACFHTAYQNRVRFYPTVAAMVADGFRADGIPVAMATKAFSQNPRPSRVAIGRRALPTTQTIRLYPVEDTIGTVYTFAIDGVTITHTVPSGGATIAAICTALALAINTDVLNVDATAGADYVEVVTDQEVITSYVPAVTTVGYVYRLTYEGVTVTYTVQTGDTVALICAALALLLDAIPGVTAVDGVTDVDLTLDHTGLLLDYTGFTDPDLITLQDVSADPGIATDLTAIEAEDPTSWYGLALDSNSAAEVKAAAAWVESRLKVFAFNTSDSDAADSTAVADLFSFLDDAGYARTFGLYSQRQLLSWSGLCWLANRLPTDPGRSTWKFKTLASVLVDTLSETAQGAIAAKHGNHYVEVAGLSITQNGQTFAGEWIDTTIFIDWLTQRMKESIFATLASNEKVPYTDTGVDLMRGVVLAKLNQGIKVGGLAADPAPTCTAPKVSEIDVADRAERILPDVEFTATLAGAIHKVIVRGNVSV